MTVTVFDPPEVQSPARGFPPGCTVRRALRGDAERVASLLRAEDRLEMEALEGRPALDVLQGWMSSGPHVLTIRGEAAAIFGIVPCLDLRANYRLASPWGVVVATLNPEDLIDVVWLSRLQIDAWQRRWAVLRTVCDARNQFRSRWLDWLGFQCRGRVECFGAAGLPFDLHVRLGDVSGFAQ